MMKRLLLINMVFAIMIGCSMFSPFTKSASAAYIPEMYYPEKYDLSYIQNPMPSYERIKSDLRYYTNDFQVEYNQVSYFMYKDRNTDNMTLKVIISNGPVSLYHVGDNQRLGIKNTNDYPLSAVILYGPTNIDSTNFIDDLAPNGIDETSTQAYNQTASTFEFIANNDTILTRPLEIGIKDITTTSAILYWDEISQANQRYRIRINGSGMAQDVIAYVNAGGLKYEYYLRNLQKGKGYNAYIRAENAAGTEFSTENVVSFFTNASDTKVLNVFVENKPWNQSTSLQMNIPKDILIKAIDHKQVDFYINDVKVGTQQNISENGNTLLASTYKHLVSDQHPNFLKVVLTDKSDVVTSHFYGFNVTKAGLGSDPTLPGTSLPGYDPEYWDGITQDDPDYPVQPTAPDSGWDLIGWVKYIADWLIYIVKIVVYLIKSLGSGIEALMGSVGNLSTILTSFFSFLPIQVTTLMALGLILAILLRVFKR